MPAEKKRTNNFIYGSTGVPGNYTLNQKVSKFGDRRTKRERDRSTQNRKSVERSMRDE